MAPVLLVALSVITCLKAPTAIVALLTNHGIYESTTSVVELSPFRQVVVTRHVGHHTDEYCAAIRYHVGPIGFQLGAKSLFSKCPPELQRQRSHVTLASYAGTIRVDTD